MEFLEKDLEEIIFNTNNRDLLNRGLSIYGKKFRQVGIGNYGRADLVTFDKEYYPDEKNNLMIKPIVTVYELKKDKIGVSAFLQALGYVRGLEKYFDGRRPDLDIEFRIILIGRKLDTHSSFSYLPDYLNGFLTNYTYSYNVDGLKFEAHYHYYLKSGGVTYA